jgi:AraC family transcriptional regulator
MMNHGIREGVLRRRPEICSNEVERLVDFPRGLAEIRRFDWTYGDRDIPRLRPDKYVFGLSLASAASGARKALAGTGPLPSGRITIIPPGREVGRNLVQGLHRSLFCLLDAEQIHQFVPGPLQQRLTHLPRITPRAASRFEWLLRNIYEELRHDRRGRANMIASFADVLAMELARSLEDSRDDRNRRQGGLAPWRLRLIQQRAESDAAMPGVAELADLCGLTVRHLCRAFKIETGQTPGEYVDAVMARQARRLLNETDLPLTQIAHRLGFATSSSFANAFQRMTGLKPRQIERPREATDRRR